MEEGSARRPGPRPRWGEGRDEYILLGPGSSLELDYNKSQKMFKSYLITLK